MDEHKNDENSSQNTENSSNFEQNSQQNAQNHEVKEENTPDYPIEKAEKESSNISPVNKARGGRGNKEVNTNAIIRNIIIIIIVALGIWYFTGDKTEDNNQNDNNDNTEAQGSINQNNHPAEEPVIKNNEEIKDNTTGNVINDEKIEIMSYFSKNDENCDEVYPLKREISEKYDVESVTALISLLTPLSEEEKQIGFTSNIPEGTYLNNIFIDGAGVATVKFSENLNNIAGSCAVIAVRAQIEETLKQFSYVNSVVICVMDNCNQDEILQP